MVDGVCIVGAAAKAGDDCRDGTHFCVIGVTLKDKSVAKGFRTDLVFLTDVPTVW